MPAATWQRLPACCPLCNAQCFVDQLCVGSLQLMLKLAACVCHLCVPAMELQVKSASRLALFRFSNCAPASQAAGTCTHDCCLSRVCFRTGVMDGERDTRLDLSSGVLFGVLCYAWLLDGEVFPCVGLLLVGCKGFAAVSGRACT
jgi:hypothetical protein